MRGNSHTIITEKQVKLLISQGEGLIVEFKERYTPRIEQDIVAFSNARAEPCFSVSGMMGPSPESA